MSENKNLDINEKCCSRCCEKKEIDKFIKNRNICKGCNNKRRKEKYDSIDTSSEVNQTCNVCNAKKLISSFVKNKLICKDCNNANRRAKYETDEELRLKLIQQASEFKHNKVLERRKMKLEEIGEGNKKCSKCFEIKLKDRFRYNRLKCRDCERDDPKDKLRRAVRTRIWYALTKKKKNTIEYLGCNHETYIKWILYNNNNYNLENHGKEWHIDHVIPLYHFNLENEEEQLLAFNWRNTTPLSANENLSKNNKIIKSQIEQHLQQLLKYHTENNIEMPKKFIELYAKHLDDGEPPKVITTTPYMETLKGDLG